MNARLLTSLISHPLVGVDIAAMCDHDYIVVEKVILAPGSFEKSAIIPELRGVSTVIHRYLDGKEQRALSELITVDLSRFTPFTRDVYSALIAIPYGKTVTYGELAQLAGHPYAVRAAASALRKNPLPLIIPCHRVVSASGIGGFMGKTEGESVGLKKRLIALEAKFSMI